MILKNANIYPNKYSKTAAKAVFFIVLALFSATFFTVIK